MTHIRFNDEIETYNPSDSDEEYTSKEKDLLKKVRSKRATYSDSEEEVYGLSGNESEDSNESNIAKSDIDSENDDLPDVRAWGKNKRHFYSADYVDPDYGGYQGKDAMLADFEEEEAQNIQKRLAEQLDDDDFALEIFNKKTTEATEKDKEKEIEVIKSDLSSMPKRQLLELLQRESPELFQLLEDYREKMKIVKEYIAPIIEMVKTDRIGDCRALDFVKTYYHLLVGYCTNINMYFLLKASEVNVGNHPVIKRLYQYRKFITQMEPIYIEIIKPQLEILLHEPTEVEKSIKPKVKKAKKLRLVSNLDNPIVKEIKKRVSFNLDVETAKPKVDEFKVSKVESDNLVDEVSNDALEISESSEEPLKRAITYQMAKNKGLTPQRKKEQRNPRVKHRNKYRKAIIRRKGAVREVRKELSRYGGEISGIKTSVTKSVKIK